MAAPKKLVPKHVELREKLRSRFQRMSPNALIPSARDLAKTYKVSAMTVRQALVALQLSVLPPLVFATAAQKYLVKGLSSGAVKG
jgi:DNA-binding GntR family transcriptional regulator